MSSYVMASCTHVVVQLSDALQHHAISLKDVGRTCANWHNQEHKQEHNNCFISVTDPYLECMEHCAGYR